MRGEVGGGEEGEAKGGREGRRGREYCSLSLFSSVVHCAILMVVEGV